MGVGSIPLWCNVLDAAEEWGTPPWEISEDGNKLLWFLRWRVYKSEQVSAIKDKRKHGGDG